MVAYRRQAAEPEIFNTFLSLRAQTGYHGFGRGAFAPYTSSGSTSDCQYQLQQKSQPLQRALAYLAENQVSSGTLPLSWFFQIPAFGGSP